MVGWGVGAPSRGVVACKRVRGGGWDVSAETGASQIRSRAAFSLAATSTSISEEFVTTTLTQLTVASAEEALVSPKLGASARPTSATTASGRIVAVLASSRP